MSAAQKDADLVLYGHTHQPHLEVLPTGTEVGSVLLHRPMYVFNPGSIGAPYDGNFTYGLLTISGTNVLFSIGKEALGNK